MGLGRMVVGRTVAADRTAAVGRRSSLVLTWLVCFVVRLGIDLFKLLYELGDDVVVVVVVLCTSV